MNLDRYLSMLPMLVDSNKDLFNQAWTEGDLYSIQGIVDKLGTFACWVISIVGFGIVIFSILKNAFSGLYVVNPQFWEKVDEVKTQATQTVSSGIEAVTGKTGNVGVQKLGGFLIFLLGAIPNIKALTDFDEGAPVDKKQYFTKSLLLLVAQIFIGMMIFYGYPSKIANWIGGGATYALSAIINNVDPVAVVEGVSDSFVVYNLSTDGSQNPLEQKINEMANSAVSVMGTKYTDISKANMQELALQLESTLISAFDGEAFDSVLGADQGYTVNINCIIQSNVPTVSKSYGEVGNGVKMAQANNGTVSYKYWSAVSSIMGNNSGYTTKDVSADYFVWSITATPVAVENISSANIIVFAGINAIQNVTSDNFSITINGFTVGKGDGDIHGTLGKNVVVYAIDKDGNPGESFNATLQTASVSQQEAAVPILSFSKNDRTRFSSAQKDAAYFKIGLVGEWNITVKGSKSDSTMTVRVTELRLTTGSNNKATYAVSTWTDVNSTTTKGVSELTIEVLKRSNSEGKKSGSEN